MLLHGNKLYITLQTMCYIRIVEYHSATKRNEDQNHATFGWNVSYLEFAELLQCVDQCNFKKSNLDTFDKYIFKHFPTTFSLFFPIYAYVHILDDDDDV